MKFTEETLERFMSIKLTEKDLKTLEKRFGKLGYANEFKEIVDLDYLKTVLEENTVSLKDMKLSDLPSDLLNVSADNIVAMFNAMNSKSNGFENVKHYDTVNTLEHFMLEYLTHVYLELDNFGLVDLSDHDIQKVIDNELEIKKELEKANLEQEIADGYEDLEKAISITNYLEKLKEEGFNLPKFDQYTVEISDIIELLNKGLDKVSANAVEKEDNVEDITEGCFFRKKESETKEKASSDTKPLDFYLENDGTDMKLEVEILLSSLVAKDLTQVPSYNIEIMKNYVNFVDLKTIFTPTISFFNPYDQKEFLNHFCKVLNSPFSENFPNVRHFIGNLVIELKHESISDSKSCEILITKTNEDSSNEQPKDVEYTVEKFKEDFIKILSENMQNHKDEKEKDVPKENNPFKALENLINGVPKYPHKSPFENKEEGNRKYYTSNDIETDLFTFLSKFK